MVNFSIFDAIGNGNNDNPIPVSLEDFKKSVQVAPSNNKSNHEVTAAAQPKAQIEYFSIFHSIGLQTSKQANK